MKLIELIRAASEGYDDGYVETAFNEMYDEEGNPKFKLYRAGDSLAEFVAIELAETFDPDNCDLEQIKEAIRVIEAGVVDLNGVLGALDKLYDEKMADISLDARMDSHSVNSISLCSAL